MTIPIAAMLGFAVWTQLLLFGSIGVYRWGLILTGRATIREWNPNVVQGAAWYGRAMRAHVNCIENLPVFAVIVIAGVFAGYRASAFDTLAVAVIAARIAHSLVHVLFEQTERVAGLRFGLFFVQAVSMFVMAILICLHLTTA